MKELVLLLTISILFSCAPEQTERLSSEIKYPKTLSKVFFAHGGIDKWKEQRTLSYDIVTDKGREMQTIDLQNRREYIVGTNFTMGHEGTQTWVKADTSYNGNPVFYKNLMFYFYAMPFVIGDPGINYVTATPLSFEGKEYPGIKISYNSGVGISPEDEYFLHYNPDTYQMEWLGYTVTYFSGKKSDAVKWIRYTEWQENKDVLLPIELTWYNTEEGKPVSPRSARKFENITLSKEAKSDKFYEMIDGGKIAE